MAAMSDYLKEALINHIFRGTTFTEPNTYVALCTASISSSDNGGTMTEVATGAGYSRIAASSWSDPTAGTIGETDNASIITFPTATDDWGTITSVAIMDSATRGAGNILFFGDVDVSTSVGVGFTFSFSEGSLNIQLQ